MHCPAGNATDPIWRVLASSQGISSWTLLKPQHSNPNRNPNPLAIQLWCIDFLTPPTPLIIPHRLPAFLESLMPLKNWCSIHARWSKSSLKLSIRFCGIFSKFKTIKSWQFCYVRILLQSICTIYDPQILHFFRLITFYTSLRSVRFALLYAHDVLQFCMLTTFSTLIPFYASLHSSHFTLL